MTDIGVEWGWGGGGEGERNYDVSKYTWCLTSTETVRLIRDGEKGGKGVRRWGKREIIYQSLHCHHQNDFYIKVGSVKSHFNVL